MVLVTGGTGLLGSHLLWHLCKGQEKVRAIYRDQKRLETVKKVFGYYTDTPMEVYHTIEWVQADILDIPALDAAFAHVAHVYHAAALISFDPRKFPLLQKINVEGTANVINLCLSHNIKKICHVSTIGAIGHPTHGGPANEDTEWNARHANVYAITKYQAEMEVWRGSQEGLETVIVNPGVIIGPGFWDTGSGALFKLAYGQKGVYPPGGTGFVSVANVVQCMVALMRSTVKNERFILVDQNLTYGEVLGQLARLMGKRPPARKLKFWQLRMLQFLDRLASFFLNRERRITNETVFSLKNRGHYATDKIKNALNMEFEPLAKALAFGSARFMEEKG